MEPKTFSAHFDGEQIRLDEPYELETNARLLVTVLPQMEGKNGEQGDWLRLSRNSLSNAYGSDEVEYSLTLIREPNPEYEGR